MKIDVSLVRQMLEEVKDESLKPVADEPLMKDAMEKMYNFGVWHFYHVMLIKLYKADEISKGVSA